MQYKFLLFGIICIFVFAISDVLEKMINDANTIILFIGFLVAIVIAILVLFIILYYFFSINLLNILWFKKI